MPPDKLPFKPTFIKDLKMKSRHISPEVTKITTVALMSKNMK